MSKRHTRHPFARISPALSLAATTAGLIIVSGCLPAPETGQDSTPPPSPAQIFEPDPNHVFDTDTGSVTINRLTSQTVCYTTDNSSPSYADGGCTAGDLLSGSTIALSCDESDTSANSPKTIKLAFNWGSSTSTASSSYILDCSPPPVDTDVDGIPDGEDNCPTVWNDDQADSDGDGVGDACEGIEINDADNDGKADEIDNCINVWNANQGDEDNDLIGDVCDPEPRGPEPLPWANDDFTLEFVHWKDQVQCKIRCSDPTGGGDMGTYSCPGGGTANWKVEVNIFGGKADSYFTYTNCDFTTEAKDGSPGGERLVVNGKLVQYSDFNGNGTERTPNGPLTVSAGDFVGTVQSFTAFHNKTRDGGYFKVSCSENNVVDGEICAPNNLETDHYYPNWECQGVLCQEPRPPLVDTDGDGVFDPYDNCVDDHNPSQANADFDEFGSACDLDEDTTDRDGDTIPDSADNCPDDQNPGQEDEDNDGLGDACDDVFNPDADGDGVPDDNDNCPSTANGDQADADSDGEGDACDVTDNDDDGVYDWQDNCPTVKNATQSDADGDGIGNPCDSTPGFAIVYFKFGDSGSAEDGDYVPGVCMKAKNGDVQTGTGCDPSNPKNQWEIIDVPNGPAAIKVFKSVDTGQCIRGNWAGTVSLQNCDYGNKEHQWTVERYENKFDFRFPSRLHNVDHNFCLYTNGTKAVYGSLGNCNLLGTEKNRQIGIYYGGDFEGSEPFEP